MAQPGTGSSSHTGTVLNIFYERLCLGRTEKEGENSAGTLPALGLLHQGRKRGREKTILLHSGRTNSVFAFFSSMTHLKAFLYLWKGFEAVEVPVASLHMEPHTFDLRPPCLPTA